MKVNRVFILAGEASGDLYGGQVMRALREQHPGIEVRAWGGEHLEDAGALVSQHYRDLAYMGFWEVLLNLRTIRSNLKRCWEEIEAFAPDVLLGIDFPGFNLRIARKAKANGIVVHHYISPSIWAWRKGRLKGIQQAVDRMYVILPFEKPLYEAVDLDVQFVGHPLLDAHAFANQTPNKRWRQAHSLPEDGPIVALLPGSRTQELKRMLPLMCEAAKRLPSDTIPVIAGAPGQPKSAYANAPFPVLFGSTQSLLQHARCAWVTSGTATLECALFKTPQIIVYKTGTLNYLIARIVVRVQHIGLPNILLKRAAIPELIQSDCTAQQLHQSLMPLLIDGPERAEQITATDELQHMLGECGAGRRVAQGILNA